MVKKAYKKRYKIRIVDKTKMLVFPRNDIDRVLNIVGASVNQSNRIIFDGVIQRCEGCKNEIEKEHLGTVMPNSEHFYCDNPACFSAYVRKFKLR